LNRGVFPAGRKAFFEAFSRRDAVWLRRPRPPHGEGAEPQAGHKISCLLIERSGDFCRLNGWCGPHRARQTTGE
jgi:hypothetical protein